MIITPITVSTKHKLIKSYKNHIRGYDFISNLLGTAKYGIDNDTINNYKDIITVFTDNGTFHYINELQIPVGTLDVYGIKKIKNNMEKICKNCKYWTYDSNNFGECHSDNFVYSSCISFRNEKTDSLLYGDHEMYAAFFYTGEQFGCIHFEERK